MTHAMRRDGTRSHSTRSTAVLRFGRGFVACLAVGLAAVAGGAVPPTPRAALPDSMDTATQPSAFAARGATSAVARQGRRFIAVGARGLILVSSDGAATWRQVVSPVSSDLVSVKFVEGGTAWAVGHDAVALRTVDYGATWQKMLDGRAVLALLRRTYGDRARSGDVAAAAMVKEIERSVLQSATPDVLPAPFLDIWFADADEGWLVGAFGLILRTTDGGKRWEPWIDRLDNERRFHLYAITGAGTQRYIAGEQGLLLRLDAGTQRFVKVETPYNGTFFGLDLQGERLVAFGLRGNAYARLDAQAPWIKIETGIDANLVAAVDVPSATGGPQLMLVSQSGDVLSVAPDFRSATALPLASRGDVLGAVADGSGKLVLARPDGVLALAVAAPAPEKSRP